MNKIRLIVVGSITCLFLACGPTAEEKAAQQKLVDDSIAAAQAQLEAAKDAARQQMVEDSIRQAESTQEQPQ